METAKMRGITGLGSLWHGGFLFSFATVPYNEGPNQPMPTLQ